MASGNLRCVKLGNVDDLSECGDVCNLRKSNRWWQKVGRGEKELLVVTRLGSRGVLAAEKGCGWLPIWNRGVVAAEKGFVGGYPIRKSSRSDGGERCG